MGCCAETQKKKWSATGETGVQDGTYSQALIEMVVNDFYHLIFIQCLPRAGPCADLITYHVITHLILTSLLQGS